jgi:hypothetical protein
MLVSMAHSAVTDTGGSLVPVYYIVSIASVIVAGLLAVRTYTSKMKKDWIAQGSKEASLADKLEANTAAASENTKAINRLSAEMSAMIVKTETRLGAHDRRIDRLEARKSPL